MTGPLDLRAAETRPPEHYCIEGHSWQGNFCPICGHGETTGSESPGRADHAALLAALREARVMLTFAQTTLRVTGVGKRFRLLTDEACKRIAVVLASVKDEPTSP